jgi:hypothetical protein
MRNSRLYNKNFEQISKVLTETRYIAIGGFAIWPLIRVFSFCVSPEQYIIFSITLCLFVRSAPTTFHTLSVDDFSSVINTPGQAKRCSCCFIKGCLNFRGLPSASAAIYCNTCNCQLKKSLLTFSVHL